MNTLNRTIETQISESEIEKYAKLPDVQQLKDPRWPVYLRFKKDRSKGSWYYVLYQNGSPNWRKVGSYPLLSAAEAKKQFPLIQQRLAGGANLKGVHLDHFSTVGELLAWYVQRTNTNQTISAYRRRNVKSVSFRHLIPLLGSLQLRDLSKAVIEELFIWPQQQKYKLSTVKAQFNVLVSAFAKARVLELITANPMAEIKLSQSVNVSMPIKEGKLKQGDLPELMQSIEKQPGMAATLVYMMVSHATRIGETRRAKWSHFDLSNMTWYIPPQETKAKKAPHTLPITEEVFTFLRLHRHKLQSQGYSGEYLFPANPTNSKSNPITETEANELIKQISSGKWTSHDLRKLASTTWKENGEDYLVVKFLLNHHIPNLDRTYIQAYIEPQKKEVLTRWQQLLSEMKTKTIARW